MIWRTLESKRKAVEDRPLATNPPLVLATGVGMERLALRALRALLDKLHSRRAILRLSLSSKTQILISEEGEAGASQAPPTPAPAAAAEEEEDMAVWMQVREWHTQTLMILQVPSETHHQTVVVAMMKRRNPQRLELGEASAATAVAAAEQKE